MQLCIYQFCVVKPLVSLILAVLETVGVRQPGVIDAGSVFLSLVKATSLVISARVTTQWGHGAGRRERTRFLNRDSRGRAHGGGRGTHIAMLALFTFYRFCHQLLKSYNILFKFMIIKVVIFLNVLYAGARCARRRRAVLTRPPTSPGGPLTRQTMVCNYASAHGYFAPDGAYTSEDQAFRFMVRR